MSMMTFAGAERMLPVGPGGSPALDLAGHLATHGPLAIPTRNDPGWKAVARRAVAESGLLGRGGAGFPAAAKWGAIDGGWHRPVVVVNAMEGEPASAKDRVLLTRAPHLVLEGAEVAAAVIGASEILICVAEHNGPAAASIGAAIAERQRAGMLVHRTSVRRPPGGYVTGEESSLVTWLSSGRALPFFRTDKSVPVTVGRGPALVHNAETLSQVALIARHGPAWFRGLGTAEAPGSTLVTVTGAVRTPGVLEVELGTPVADILARACVDTELSAVLLGGYGGAWLDAAELAVPYAPGPLKAAGTSHGVGVIIALPRTSCGVAETARIARYMAGESVGQCGPCIFGLPAIADDLEQLWAGGADAGVVDRIQMRAAAVEGRGACRHPDGVVRLVRSALMVFAADTLDHAQGRPCSGHASPTVLSFPEGAAGTRRSA